MRTVHKTRFRIEAMDCPSEEQLIRTALANAEGISRLDFDIPQRSLTVWHHGECEPITATLTNLDLGTSLVDSEEVTGAGGDESSSTDLAQSGVLRWLLAINAAMFVAEAVVGWLGESVGLLSDSLDMLADATVYGIALWAVGKAVSAQQRAARISGWFQLVLAIGMFGEVARRAALGSSPEPPLMMATAAVALLANVACLLLLARHRGGGLHMRASWIFSTNDVIANLGVIAAGALVHWTSSAAPDLVIGTIIGAVVLRGALRILKLAHSG